MVNIVYRVYSIVFGINGIWYRVYGIWSLNIRILQTMISGIPLTVGLRTRL